MTPAPCKFIRNSNFLKYLLGQINGGNSYMLMFTLDHFLMKPRCKKREEARRYRKRRGQKLDSRQHGGNERDMANVFHGKEQERR